MRKLDRDWSIALIGALILFALAAKVGYATVTYGDWTCAFANCVKVEVRK